MCSSPFSPERIKRLFRMQSDKDKKVLSALDEIEAEMKEIGFWNANPPEVRAGSYLEAPCFELWLQCVFLPKCSQGSAERRIS